MEVTDKDREMILRFLFKVERRMVQSRPKPSPRKGKGRG
jgi:hypothetical protein